MKTRPPAVIAALAALGFLVACSSSNPDSSDRPVQAGSPKTHALRQVSLPDMTGMSPSVQQQLRDQAGEVTRLAAGNAPADQRATAFGEMGKLLLAVESFGDAEACFLNASELNPSDSRWAYYLGHVYRAQGESQKAAAYFERALKARPDDVAALVWLGNMYLDQGEPWRPDRCSRRRLRSMPPRRLLTSVSDVSHSQHATTRERSSISKPP